jgi:hypothetical protein
MFKMLQNINGRKWQAGTEKDFYRQKEVEGHADGGKEGCSKHRDTDVVPGRMLQ